MLITGNEFSVLSWRLVGILSVSAGIWVAGRTFSKLYGTISAMLFLLLIVTDSTILMTSRHDWGPTAFALALRLILISVWIQG